jgi:hypothetical protein
MTGQLIWQCGFSMTLPYGVAGSVAQLDFALETVCAEFDLATPTYA